MLGDKLAKVGDEERRAGRRGMSGVRGGRGRMSRHRRPRRAQRWCRQHARTQRQGGLPTTNIVRSLQIMYYVILYVE